MKDVRFSDIFSRQDFIDMKMSKYYVEHNVYGILKAKNSTGNKLREVIDFLEKNGWRI